MKRAVLFGAMVLVTLPVFAQDNGVPYFDGNKLHAWAVDWKKLNEQERGANTYFAFEYIGYIAGAFDQFLDWRATDIANHRSSTSTPWALPKNLQLSQLCAVVAKYLSDHPEKWNETAASLVIRAITDAFPRSH